MALVMCVAALAAVICQFLRQPLVVGYLVAGMRRAKRAGRVRQSRAGPARRGARCYLVGFLDWPGVQLSPANATCADRRIGSPNSSRRDDRARLFGGAAPGLDAV